MESNVETDTVPLTSKFSGEEENLEKNDINRNYPSLAARYNRKKDANEDSTAIEIFSTQQQVRRTRPQEIPPIDEKTCFDVFISCGFGAKSYTLGPKFASPRFRVKFASKLYYVLLAQLLLCIAWMSYVPSSPNLSRIDDIMRGMVATAIIVYLVIFIIARFSSCEGMCLMGHMLLMIIVTVCLAVAFGVFVVIFPTWIFVLTALWCTLVLVTIANCTPWGNILTRSAFIVAAVGSLASGTAVIASGFYFSVPANIAPTVLYDNIITVFIITPLLSMFVVHEVKKLIGGRRAGLEGHEWILAAVII
ncbi:unnamed protein product [Allacma fusca]|uniref:Uncharacterized protein n=1 Tax=Allacma fusca TaxID=39272 RepID=A0A8J2L061_9HEXA|nr:unnamed protein product [Allacma fusca]